MIEKIQHDNSKKWLLWEILTLTVLTLTFFEFPYLQNSTVTPKWVIISLLCFPLYFIKTQRTIKFNTALIIWFVFTLQYGLQCFRSYNFWDSLIYVIPLLIVPIFTYLLASKIDDIKEFYSKLSLLIVLMITPLFFVALIEIIALYLDDNYTHATSYSFKYAFGHRNSFSQFIVLLIPLILLGYKAVKWKKRLIITSISLIYVLAILLMNKTVLLILFGVYPAMFSLFYLSKLSKKVKTLGISIVLLLLISTIGLMASGELNNTSQLGKIFTTDYGSGNERIRIWKNSYDIFKTEPLIGKGSGDWKIEILNTNLRFTQAEQSMVFYKRAHNDFIQIAVENGLLGLSLIMLFFIVVIIGLAKSKIDKNIKFILLSGVLGFLVVMNTSFPLEKIELVLLLFLFILPLFTSTVIRNGQSKVSFLLLILNSTLFLSAIFWCVKEINYFESIDDNNMKQLEQLDLDVYSITPDVLPTYSILATDLTLKEDYKRAIKVYEKALIHNPYHVHVLNGIGSSYYALGDFEKAKEFYKKALKVNPNFSETLLNHTALMFNNGDVDGALDELLKVVIGWEPSNYYKFMLIITKAKCEWLIDLHNEPNFESFLIKAKEDDDLLYEISTNARKSGACFEDELRIYFSHN